jgi:hypothetical protein
MLESIHLKKQRDLFSWVNFQQPISPFVSTNLRKKIHTV